MFGLFMFLFACGNAEDKSTDTSSVEDTGEVEEVEEEEEVVETSICDEDYSFCGSLMMPADMVGAPRSMAIALYDSLEPAGPPNVTVTEIATPEVVAGEAYEIEFAPLIATGSYYIFVFLYMEGGGEWAPVSGIDYHGNTSEPIVFDGSPVMFSDINLSLAE